MSGELGLIIDDQHERTINSLAQVPVAFGAPSDDLPDEWVPPLFVENQGSTSSCAGHSEALACSHANYVATGEVVRFSRWLAYLTAQKAGGFYGRDQGTSISSTLEAATNTGVCLESEFPFPGYYDPVLPLTALTAAGRHRHHGDKAYDCRDWDTALAWLTDRRAIIIGTRWYSGQDGCRGIEDKRCSSGSFRGYHARCLTGWSKHGGILCPVVQNSHGSQWANQGRATITRDQWDYWCGDPNFCAFGFNAIDEVEPKRRSWSESKPGDVC